MKIGFLFWWRWGDLHPRPDEQSLNQFFQTRYIVDQNTELQSTNKL